MRLHRFKRASILASAIVMAAAFAGCGGGGGGGQSQASSVLSTSPTAQPTTLAPAGSVAPVATAAPAGHRSHFLGAFFRPEGAPPFGVFEPQSPGLQSPALLPQPYPAAGTTLTGANGYCHGAAANGVSIAGSDIVDPTKLADVVNLGVGWTRLTAPQFTDDSSHILGAGNYNFTDFDAAQCATLVDHGMQPVIGFSAGPVQYNATPGTFSPQSDAIYQSAADFAQWCSIVTTHEQAVFGVSRFSVPGNEVNTNEAIWPGGEAQIAAYTESCYSAIKRANPQAFVYGFELNMDGNVNAPAFVARMYALGCKVGTCYDGIAMHLGLRYPPLPAGTPCYPNPNGNYTVACIADIQSAAQAKVHLLMSETEYPVPASVPDEQTKALAIVADFTTMAQDPDVDGVQYGNVDECALYPTGFWAGGCLIDTSGNLLPGYTALQSLALTYFQ